MRLNNWENKFVMNKVSEVVQTEAHISWSEFRTWTRSPPMMSNDTFDIIEGEFGLFAVKTNCLPIGKWGRGGRSDILECKHESRLFLSHRDSVKNWSVAMTECSF